ncbi:LUD domain-containing protein [Thermogymnomonas acidicola]
MGQWDVAIERALQNNIPRVEQILSENPYILDLAREIRETKLAVLEHLDDYVQKTIRAVERTGGRAYLARDAEEARKIVDDIIGERKRVVFSKSNVAYEVGLREHLVSRGLDAWETDLGEYLIQLTGEPPAHIVFPALHMPKEAVGDLLNRFLNGAVNSGSTHEEMVAAVRSFLMEKYMKAQVGITGANAVAADTGSVALLENEGNIRMDTVVPEVHIAITGIDKIVPTLHDAMKELIVQAAYGGLYPPSYINISSGPSSTADIELKRVSPATGPREFHVILLDNGRSMANRDPGLREALLCIKCGRCYFSCPVYRVMGASWGDPPYGGPMGAMWSAIIKGDYRQANLCTHSGGCRDVCPVGIDIPRVLEYIKWRSVSHE